MIDKHGKCPNCNTNWDAGDIKDNLRSLNVLSHKTEYELTKAASLYGWQEEKPIKFSKVSIIVLEDKAILYKCPEIRCGHLFDANTGEEFEYLLEAKNSHYKIIEV